MFSWYLPSLFMTWMSLLRMLRRTLTISVFLFLRQNKRPRPHPWCTSPLSRPGRGARDISEDLPQCPHSKPGQVSTFTVLQSEVNTRPGDGQDDLETVSTSLDYSQHDWRTPSSSPRFQSNLPASCVTPHTRAGSSPQPNAMKSCPASNLCS